MRFCRIPSHSLYIEIYTSNVTKKCSTQKGCKERKGNLQVPELKRAFKTRVVNKEAENVMPKRGSDPDTGSTAQGCRQNTRGGQESGPWPAVGRNPTPRDSIIERPQKAAPSIKMWLENSTLGRIREIVSSDEVLGGGKVTPPNIQEVETPTCLNEGSKFVLSMCYRNLKIQINVVTAPSN